MSLDSRTPSPGIGRTGLLRLLGEHEIQDSFIADPADPADQRRFNELTGKVIGLPWLRRAGLPQCPGDGVETPEYRRRDGMADQRSLQKRGGRRLPCRPLRRSGSADRGQTSLNASTILKLPIFVSAKS